MRKVFVSAQKCAYLLPTTPLGGKKNKRFGDMLALAAEKIKHPIRELFTSWTTRMQRNELVIHVGNMIEGTNGIKIPLHTIKINEIKSVLCRLSIG